MPSEPLPAWRISIALFLGALTVRVVVVVVTGFDGLYGQDAYAYFDQAMGLRATLMHGVPAPQGFFWPQGYPALVALMSLVVGSGPAAAQLVSLLMGSAVAPLTFLVGRQLLPKGNDGAAILAAVLTMVAGQAVLSSIVAMSDAAAVALILMSMWAVLTFRNTPRRWPLLVLAGTFAGAAVTTRWAAMLVGPALALAVLDGLRKKEETRRLIPAVVTLSCIGSGLALLAISSVETFDFAGYFHFWHPVNAVWGPIPEIPSHSLAAMVPGLIYYLAPLYHPAFLGPFLGSLAGWGLRQLWKDHDRASVLILILWTVVPLAFFVGLPLRSLRICLTNMVPFVLLAVWGAWTLLPRFILGKAVRAAIVLSLVLITSWTTLSITRFTSNENHTRDIAEGVQSMVPEDAIVLTFEITPVLKHHTELEVVELFEQDPVSLGALVDRQQPLFILVRTSDIAERWTDQAPGLNIRWLEAHGQLITEAQWGDCRLSRFESRKTSDTSSPQEAPPQ